MKNFWKNLDKPFFALAPMDDVTDTVFRQVISSCGKPDVLFTEFLNTDALISEKGYPKLASKLKYFKEERPLVAQIWGTKPENFFKAAGILKSLGFDGIDINMGCPDRKVLKNGGGGALIDNPNLALKIIRAVKEGAPGIPISVKTRIGISEIKTEEWAEVLLKQDIAALTIHGRTVKEQSKVPAHWEEIGRAVNVRNSLGKDTLIIGNGDIKSYQEGLEKVKKYKVDGIMIGRGVFQSPWIFNRKVDPGKIIPQQKLQLLLNHIRLFKNTWGESKKFIVLRKYFQIYLAGFPGAKDLRGEVVRMRSLEEVEEKIRGIKI